MTLPKGLPTLQHKATKRWTRPDNVFASEHAIPLVVSCTTAPALRGPGTDHMPILTVVNFTLSCKAETPFRNFRQTDWEKWDDTLSDNLKAFEQAAEIRETGTFHRVQEGLTRIIQDTISQVVPLSKPCPHSRRWWNDDLNKMDKQLNRLANLAYRYRALSDHPSHGEF
ncbi:hypothetical protein EV122DRAFT_194388, partial [Schizophyllum commune]